MMMQSGAERQVHRLGALLAGMAEVPADCDISGLSMDSREVHHGDLFLACGGLQTHGARYIEDAIRAGVAAVAWDASALPPESRQVPPGENSSPRVPVVAVENLAKLVGVIADRFYGQPSRALYVVGITGTNGKTSCAQFIARALDQDDQPCGVIGTLGYGLLQQQQPASHTTPDAVRLHALLRQMQDQGARCVVMEVSSHALDQGRVNGVAFDVALFTNLSRDHLDYHGDEQSYAQAKRGLFELPGLTCAVLNGDDVYGHELLAALAPSVQGVMYGFAAAQLPAGVMQVQGAGLRLSAEGIEFEVCSPWGGGHIRSPLLGAFNASNLLAALSVLLVMKMPVAEACGRLSALTTVPGRMERYGDVSRQPLVVVDYAHTPDALQQVLQALREHCAGSLWCLFGCGGERDRGKRPLMAAVAAQYADQVVVSDDNPRHEDPQQIIAEIAAGFPTDYEATVMRDRAEAIAHVIRQARCGDVVLVAGKGHESFQLVGEQKIPFSDAEVVQALLREGSHG